MSTESQLTYLGGMTRDELEEHIRRIISDRSEGSKIDFKAGFSVGTSAEKLEFSKDLSAIANTDDDRYENFGYIILGAQRGKLLGRIDVLSKEDSFSAHLTGPTSSIHFRVCRTTSPGSASVRIFERIGRIAKLSIC